MEHEWADGDRFILEFEVTGWSGEWLECKTMSSARRAFPPSDMQYAKLIQPAAPEAQKVDLSKPLTVRRSGEPVTYLCTSSNGEIAVEDSRGGIMVYRADALENIPEPKIMGRRLVLLVEDGSVYWGDNSPDSIYRLCRDLRVVGRKWVEITEGDGMEES